MNNQRFSLFALMLTTILVTSTMSYGQARPQIAPRSAPPSPSPLPIEAPRAPVTTTSTEATSVPNSAPPARSVPRTSAPQSVTAPTESAADPQENAAPPDSDNNDHVIPAPSLMAYGHVKDNFGRRIADGYVVVQVQIKNPDIAHQFLLQDLRVVFDPNECENAKKFYTHLDIQDCRAQYDKYLTYPIAYAPMSQPTLAAVAGVGQFRNPRNVLFRSLDFLATMGGALTGFNFVGRDGKAGLSVFNGTFLTASKTFLPDLTVAQLTNLNDQSYKPNTLVENKDSKTYCIFIPTNQLFSKETWKLYKQSTKDSSTEALKLRQFLQLVLTVTASGIHIQQATGDPGTNVKRGGAARPTATPAGTSPSTSPTP